jgi:sortase (surface protein transpeptidase)
VRFLRTVSGRVVAIAVAALLGAGLTALLLDRTPAEEFTAGRPEATRLPDDVLPAAQPDSRTPQQPSTRRSGRPPAVPRLLSIPRLGLRMAVVPRGVDDQGAMALPDSASMVGWYRFGPRPLDSAGATVLAGHVDTEAEGAGPLAGLAALRAGDRIAVRAGGSTVLYRTSSVTRIAKALIDLPSVFSRSGPPRLHLVTCGGAYLPQDGGYQDNVVVVAQRLAPRPAAFRG